MSFDRIKLIHDLDNDREARALEIAVLRPVRALVGAGDREDIGATCAAAPAVELGRVPVAIRFAW